jgi:hypothetical protein
MSLKDGGFVPLPSSNAIVSTHDISQLIKRLEDVDSNSSIESCWLKHPKVLIIVTAVCQLVWSFQSFFLLCLTLIQLLIDVVYILVNMLVNELHDTQELLDAVTHVVFQVV